MLNSSDEEDSGAVPHGPLLRMPSVRVRKNAKWQVMATAGGEGDIVRRKSGSEGSSRRTSTPAALQPTTTYKELKKQAMHRYMRKHSVDASELSQHREFLIPPRSPGNHLLKRPFSVPEASTHDSSLDNALPSIPDELIPLNDIIQQQHHKVHSCAS